MTNQDENIINNFSDNNAENKNLVEVVYKPTVTPATNGNRESLLQTTDGKKDRACWFLHWAAITGIYLPFFL